MVDNRHEPVMYGEGKPPASWDQELVTWDTNLNGDIGEISEIGDLNCDDMNKSISGFGDIFSEDLRVFHEPNDNVQTKKFGKKQFIQQTISKCNYCGRMFISKQLLTVTCKLCTKISKLFCQILKIGRGSHQLMTMMKNARREYLQRIMIRKSLMVFVK
jgi:hypothetical protein